MSYQQTQRNPDNVTLRNDSFHQIQFYIDQARRNQADYLSRQLRYVLAELNRQLGLVILARQWMNHGRQRLATSTDYRPTAMAG